MKYKSIFDFLKEDKRFCDVYSISVSMEKAIISNSYNASLILSRTASELLMKIIVKNNKKLNERFYKNTEELPSFNDMIWACKEDDVIKYKIFKKYRKLQKVGNSNVHGNNLSSFGIKHAETAHKYLYDIAIECYNRFNVTIDNKYKNKLKDYDFTIEISPDERKKQLDNVRFEEINSENLISSFNLKTVFIPIHLFKNISDKYDEKILDKDKFSKDLKEFEYITDENLPLILGYFDESVGSDIVVDIKNLHDNISKDVLKTLDDLNKTDLTFKELNNLIEESSDSSQKEIFIHIKSLADDLVKGYMEEYKKEIENSPITQFAENGRKLLKYKNYKIVEDDFGFGFEEVDENIFLDDDQKEAVEYDGKKPLVINAGPGSGKTRVIIERVVYLVKKGISPDSILVITFTNKATQELRDRLLNETDLDIKIVNQIRISTVHGFCRYLIAKYEPIPYNYLTRHGERSLFFKKHKEELGFVKYSFLYNEWIPSILKKYDEYFSFKVDDVALAEFIEQKMSQYAKNNKRYEHYIDNFYMDKELTEYPILEQLQLKKISGSSYYYRWYNLAKSYPKFLDKLEDSATCDDNTVLTKANSILENDVILSQIKYKNILIDEFQDTDHNQKNIFEKLLRISETFTIVGDVDQSIYGWRGAFPEYFEEFAKKDVKYVTLHTNYRSSRNIVEFNEELIKNNRSIPKEIKAKKKYNAPIYHMVSKDSDDEASRIVSLINNLMNDKKIKYFSDVAILFRKNSSVDNLIKPLEAAGIPYHLKENNDYLDQVEVKAMLILFWYLMPYDKYKMYHLEDTFLNLKGLADDSLNEIFRLSSETRKILIDIQEKYEEDLIKKAKSVYSNEYGYLRNLKYAEIFNFEDKLKEKVFEDIYTVDFSLLDKQGFNNLGITNEYDIDFFLRLNNLKSQVFGGNSTLERLTTLKIFYELLNLTDYFSEISLENNPEDIKIKDNLALFSHIIKDYESIMGDMDYVGLFNYLNRVLKGYSCRQNELEEGFNKVHLLSMHSAKGLEYPIVIVGSLKQGLCPLVYDSDDGYYSTPNEYLEYKDDDLKVDKKKYDDEELRTIYVASTRAKEILILSSLGKNSNEIPEFLVNIKQNSDVTIKHLEPYTLSIIPKVISSKVFKQKNDFPKVRFENILEDFLYCPFRYDLANNTRFKVKLKNDKYIDIVLHRLLNSIHENSETTLDDIDLKISAIVDYHNISSTNDAYEILNNVKDYWSEWGSNYQIIDKNIKLITQLKYCDLKSVIDLVIEEDGGLSVVHFIGSDANIPNIEVYKGFLLYYIYILKESNQQFKDSKFNKVYLHSLENNMRYEIDYSEGMLAYVLNYIEEYTKSIYENAFEKVRSNCSNCEYYGSVCKG